MISKYTRTRAQKYEYLINEERNRKVNKIHQINEEEE